MNFLASFSQEFLYRLKSISYLVFLWIFMHEKVGMDRLFQMSATLLVFIVYILSLAHGLDENLERRIKWTYSKDNANFVAIKYSQLNRSICQNYNKNIMKMRGKKVIQTRSDLNIGRVYLEIDDNVTIEIFHLLRCNVNIENDYNIKYSLIIVLNENNRDMEFKLVHERNGGDSIQAELDDLKKIRTVRSNFKNSWYRNRIRKLIEEFKDDASAATDNCLALKELWMKPGCDMILNTLSGEYVFENRTLYLDNVETVTIPGFLICGLRLLFGTTYHYFVPLTYNNNYFMMIYKSEQKVDGRDVFYLEDYLKKNNKSMNQTADI